MSFPDAPSARSLTEALRRGELEVREVAAEYARRAQWAQANQELSGVATSLAEPTATRAAELQAHPGGDLWGLPLAVKDLYPIAGVRCTLGSARLAFRAQESAEPVISLLQRGAILTATTHTAELGMTSYTEPIDLPAPENPHTPGHTPGGSSGGSAVAVAQGVVPAALGSDGGGSLRVPAACCGLIGFKPAHSIAGGALATAGFLTRSLSDAILLAGLERPQPHGPARGDAAPRRVRVGITTRPFHAQVEVAPRWAAGVDQAAAALRAAGYEVVEIPDPYLGAPIDGFEVFRRTFSALTTRLPEAEYSPMVSWIRAQGHQVLHRTRPELTHRQRMSLPALIRKRWPVAAVITPTLAADPPPVGYFAQMSPAENFAAQTQWTPWLSLWNLTGWASISVPVAAAAGELATSVNIGAVHCSDQELFDIAAVVSAR